MYIDVKPAFFRLNTTQTHIGYIYKDSARKKNIQK